MNYISIENSFARLIRRHVFIQLLKYVRDSLKTNVLNVSRYHLVLRNGYKFFLSKLIWAIKDSHLKRLLLTYNYKSNVELFFKRMRIIKERKRYIPIINYSKNKLRYKAFYLLTSYFNKIQNDKDNVYLLLQMNDRYYSKVLLRNLKLIEKTKQFRMKLREFFIRLSLRGLTKNYKMENKSRELERIERRFLFKSLTLSALQAFRTHFERNKPLADLSRSYQIRIFLLNLRHLRNKKHDEIKRRRVFYESKRKSFIKRIKYQVDKKQTVTLHLNKMISSLQTCIVRETFRNFSHTYMHALDIDKSKLKTFSQMILIKKLKRSKAKSIHMELKAKINAYMIKSYNKIFANLIKRKTKHVKHNKILFICKDKLDLKAKVKLLHMMKEYHQSMLEKKNKYISSLLTYRANAIRRMFKGLKIFFNLEKMKKETYASLTSERERLINSKMLEIIFTRSLHIIRKREELISQVFITRNTKGIKAALSWYKRLKMLVQSRKQFRSCNKEEVKQKAVSNYQSNSDIKQIEADVLLLLSIKNKKRRKPISFEQIFN